MGPVRYCLDHLYRRGDGSQLPAPRPDIEGDIRRLSAQLGALAAHAGEVGAAFTAADTRAR